MELNIVTALDLYIYGKLGNEDTEFVPSGTITYKFYDSSGTELEATDVLTGEYFLTQDVIIKISGNFIEQTY